MFCPACGEPWENNTCYECGAFFEKQEFIVTDLSTTKIKHRRIYKRLDHFKEVLCQFQGKEGKVIPREVLDKIKAGIGLAKDKGSITMLDVKQSLRKLKLNRLVENLPYIHNALTGAPYPTFGGRWRTRWSGFSGRSTESCI